MWSAKAKNDVFNYSFTIEKMKFIKIQNNCTSTYDKSLRLLFHKQTVFKILILYYKMCINNNT